MAYSYVAYTGNGSTTQFSVAMPYIRKEHVHVYVNYVEQSFTWVTSTTIQLASAPVAGARVEVRRITPALLPLVDFTDGSTFVSSDLDTSNLQHLYIEQELDDTSKQAVYIDSATGLVTAGNQRITNVADPINAQDAATKNFVVSNVYNTSNIADNAITTAKINNGAVTSDKIADGTIVAGDLASNSVTTSKIVDSNVTTAKVADGAITESKLAANAVTSDKIVDGTITAGDLASNSVTTSKIVDSNVTTAKIADNAVTESKLATDSVTAGKIKNGEITSSKLNPSTVVTAAAHAGSTPNDTSFFTTSASDARYFRQDSTETISSGMPWSASDNFVATTAAIDARVIDLVDDVGGFVPIVNETSFPASNPDINNPDNAGTIVSIKEVVTTRTPVGGTVTIANGAGANTVTITGCGSTVLAAGFGVLVETTSTLHTYTFHRLVPKATEVTTVASIASDVTTVSTNIASVSTTSTNIASVNTVASNVTGVNTCATNITAILAAPTQAANAAASATAAANSATAAASQVATINNLGYLLNWGLITEAAGVPPTDYGVL